MSSEASRTYGKASRTSCETLQSPLRHHGVLGSVTDVLTSSGGITESSEESRTSGMASRTSCETLQSPLRHHGVLGGVTESSEASRTSSRPLGALQSPLRSHGHPVWRHGRPLRRRH